MTCWGCIGGIEGGIACIGIACGIADGMWVDGEIAVGGIGCIDACGGYMIDGGGASGGAMGGGGCIVCPTEGW